MNIEMIPVEIVALKADMHRVMDALRQMGALHIDEIDDSSEVSARPLTLDRETLNLQEELSFLMARVEGLINTLEVSDRSLPRSAEAANSEEIRSRIEELGPKVQALSKQREGLRSKLSMLPRYEATLRKLLPIIPASARDPGNVSVGVLISRASIGVLDSIAKRVLDLTQGRAEVVASDIDASTRAMFIVFPAEYTAQVESTLGQEDVSRLRLPEDLSGKPPDIALQDIKRQLNTIPGEIQEIDRKLAGLAAEWGDRLISWRETLREARDANGIFPRLGETDATFVIVGWTPANDFEGLDRALQEAAGERYLLQKLPLTPKMKQRAPVSLKNLGPVQPFESLVNLLALPRYGHIDPTSLMALFLPIFFGMILGDIGYGLILLTLSLVFMRKFREGVLHDILIILAMGSGWSVVFGFLYGEAFGTLGERLGLHALWFERASPEQVTGLLVMTLVIGAAHVTLGLILGVWEGIKERNRNHLLERGGMLIGLIGLFLLVGIMTNVLPGDFMTPAIAIMITGIVLLGSSLGWLGILMGPIEFIGLIGNVLSYLRIAAIGLASVYLAKVANDVAGVAGNVIVGAILALLIHALNLVLGAFSPTIHSLRLHYVEFFRKFYEGGGRPYQPYRSLLPAKPTQVKTRNG
jgi:V/A-type H+-transporting ATPase subunit I